MHYFDLPHADHIYRIHCRTPRKGNRRLRLSVDGRGEVFLSRPLRTSLQEAQAFARANLPWIAARAVPLDAHIRDPYGEGSTHWLFGKAHVLHLAGGDKNLFAHNGILQTAPAASDDIAQRFKVLHHEMSREHLPALVQSQLPLCPWVRELPPIRFRAMRKTWGTCRSDGVLTFNTRLVQYPLELIEHVIVHELCHLAEHNHSPAFYALMRVAQPDFRERHKALSAFARLLPV